MPERFEPLQEPQITDSVTAPIPVEKDRKRILHTEFGALRRDWFSKNGIELKGKNYSEVKNAIRRFYHENEVIIKESLEIEEDSTERELHELAKVHFDHEKVDNIRKKLDLPKFTSLAETVAFIKTIIDTGDLESQEKYFEYCARGISLDDMRNVLAYENDVKPARLDTDIHHQSPNRTRSVVEIASNAIDANSPDEQTIGRFGVGFYQVLSHLQSEDDVVTVRTGTKTDGLYEVNFKLIGGEIKFNITAVEGAQSGTTVTVKSANFPKDEAEEMIKRHLSYNASADISCNGEVVNDMKKMSVPTKERPRIEIEINDGGYRVSDNGKGMTPQVILEKLLVPKISGKKPFDEILREAGLDAHHLCEKRESGDTEKGKVVINVGGVTIEEFETVPSSTLKTLVIDLPSRTFLSEERNRVAVDATTIAAMKKVIEDVCKSGSVESLNSLWHAVEGMQRRSQSCSKDDNLIDHLRLSAEESLDPNMRYVPNGSGFERMRIKDRVLLNPGIKSTNWLHIDEIRSAGSMGEGLNLFVAPLDEKVEAPVIRYKNRLIISEEIYEKYKADPTVLNLYLQALGKTESVAIRQVTPSAEKQHSRAERREDQRYESLVDYLQINYHSFGFIDEGAAADFIRSRADSINHHADVVFRHVANRFPPSFAKAFVTRLLAGYQYANKGTIDNKMLVGLTEENLEMFRQISDDPELAEIFSELDMLPFDIPEKPRGQLKGIGKGGDEISTDDTEYKGQRAFGVKYCDKSNLVFEDGQRFEVVAEGCSPIYMTCTKEFFLGPDSEWSELSFVDCVSREIRKVKLEINPELREIIIETGYKKSKYCNIDGRDLILFSYQPSYRSDKGEPYSLLVDIHTGELYNPRPDLGEITEVFNDGDLTPLTSADSPEVRKANAKASADGVWGMKFSRKEDTEEVCHILLGNRRNEMREFRCGDDKEGRELVNSVILEAYGSKSAFKEEYDEHFKLHIADRIALDLDLEEVVQNAERKDFKLHRVDMREKPEEAVRIKKFFVGEQEYATVQVRAGETYIVNGDGEIIFTSGADSAILGVQLAKDGQLVCVTAERAQEKFVNTDGLFTQHNMMFFHHDPESEDVFVNTDLFSHVKILGLDGRECGIDDLKNPGCLTIRKNAASQLWSNDSDRGHYSYKKGNWDYSYKVGKVKQYSTSYDDRKLYIPYENQGDKVNMELVRLINPETGEPILPNTFRSVRYIPEKNLWECVEADDQVVDGLPMKIWHHVDESGNIVETFKKGVTIYQFDQKQGMIDYDNPARDKHIIEVERKFTNRQMDSVKKACLGRVFEGKPEIPCVLSRLYRHNYLSDENFEQVVDVLMNVEHIDDRLMNDELVSDIMTQLKDHSTESKVWFYRFASGLIPSTAGQSELEACISRLMSVYKAKMSHLPSEKKQEMFEAFETARDYDNGKYMINGWNIVKHRTPVPSPLIPENIRSVVDYLRADESEVLGTDQGRIEVADTQTFTLSQLIQAKRLSESSVQSVLSPESLDELVKSKTSGKNQEHIRREIIHPIYYQTVDNSYLFIRELVQNAHDAVIQTDETGGSNRVGIDIFSRQTGEVTLRIEDPVGMDFQTLVNYFLIPGETTKLDDEKAIGYFGQGLFTLFRGSEEVVLKTSKGDNNISKLRISPIRNDAGLIADLNIQIESEEGTMKGTIIERTTLSDSPVVEAAYVKNAVSTFTSLVDGDVVRVDLNGQRVNGPIAKLAAVDVEGMGRMTMYDAPNNVVTQRGLFIKPIDVDYDTGMQDVEALLKKRGCVLNIPDSVDLTRSRNEIAGKENVLEKMKGSVASLKMRAYLEIFSQDIRKGQIIQLENLPYDYYYFPLRVSDGETMSDVKKIVNGQPLENVEKYYDKGSLISLLIQLPAVEIEGKTYSINDLKWAALDRTSPLDKEENFRVIPKELRDKLRQGREEYDRMQSNRAAEKEKEVKDFEFKDWEKQPDWVREIISKQKGEYEEMVKLAQKLSNRVSSTITGKPKIGTTFYYEANSSAHATQGFGKIGWNLKEWNGWNIKGFSTKDLPDKQISGFLDVWSHEWGHILEKSAAATHNLNFYGKQAEALSRLMHAS